MSGIRHSTASVLVSAVLSLLIPHAGAQPHDILLKGGHVIDAANEIDAVMDVAVQENLIRKVAAAISESDAKKVDAVMRSTQNPAKAIGKFPEIGTLGESKIADITVLRLEEGVFAYKDAWGKKKLGDKKLEAVMTVRNGEIVFDLDGLAFPNWKTAGRYELIQ